MKTIAVVENRDVASLVAAILQQHGYSSTVFGAADAAAVIRSRLHVIVALITNSPWLFLEFSADLPMIYLASTPMPEMQAAFRACRIVQKPFGADDLIKALHELTTTPGSAL